MDFLFLAMVGGFVTWCALILIANYPERHNNGR